jgi:hypothetical protein
MAMEMFHEPISPTSPTITNPDSQSIYVPWLFRTTRSIDAEKSDVPELNKQAFYFDESGGTK